MPEYPRYRPGDTMSELPSDAWAGFCRAAEANDARASDVGRTPVRDFPQTGIVLVKNNSGAARQRFDVLGIDTVYPTPAANLDAFKAGPALYGITPTIAAHSGKFVVLQEPAAVDAIVTACVSGLTVAKLEVPGDVTDVRFADVKDSDASTLLASTRTGGARVLYQSSTWAIIRIDGAVGETGGVQTIRFKVLAAGPFLGDLAIECDSVVAEVIDVSCSGAGVDVGDEVIIWDPSRCNFNIPLETLIGSHGWATKMINDTYGATDCLYDLEAEGACRWVVTTLCCVEDIYA